MISLSAENRAKAGVESGDEVEVTIELDTAPREVSVPVDLVGALESDPTARAAFEALSYSRQLRHVLDVEGARTAATRQRRVDKFSRASMPAARRRRHEISDALARKPIRLR